MITLFLLAEILRKAENFGSLRGCGILIFSFLQKEKINKTKIAESLQIKDL